MVANNIKNSVIIDTSFFIALARPNDKYHKKAKQLTQTYCKMDWITTWQVLTELSHLLSSHGLIKLIQDQQKGLFKIYSFIDDDIYTFLQLLKKYSDHDIDLADHSLIVLAEKLGHGRILTFDYQDFSFLRWKNTYPFENLTTP